MIPIIITTSNLYHHLLPVFFRLYVREWNDPCTLVGYDKPTYKIPDCCRWVSLGKQRGPNYFTYDLRPFFETMPDWFMWLFEDSFIKTVDKKRLEWLISLCSPDIGRICLSSEGMNREHDVYEDIWYAKPNTNYRLSTQPSIWNKSFLLKYMHRGMTPWVFEKQDTKDNYEIIGPVISVVTHNEGVTKKDIHKLNLNGIKL